MTAVDETMLAEALRLNLAELEAELAELKAEAERKHAEHEALEQELASRRAGYARREAN